eukprot:6740545-Prymnesium_polylepis.1
MHKEWSHASKKNTTDECTGQPLGLGLAAQSRLLKREWFLWASFVYSIVCLAARPHRPQPQPQPTCRCVGQLAKPKGQNTAHRTLGDSRVSEI